MSVPFYDKLEIIIPAGGSAISVTDNTNSFGLYWSNGTPESSVTAPVGSLCSDYANGNIYKKSTGTGNTGWSLMASGTGSTNLSITKSSTTNVIESDTGTDATITAADGTNSGLMVPAQFTKLSYVTITQAVDLDAMELDIADLTTLSGAASNATHLGTFTGTTIADSVTIKTALQSLETSLETKLGSSLTNARIFVGDGSNIAVGLAMSGDVTISNTGVTTVVSASTTALGKVELSTEAETLTGTSTTLAATPKSVSDYITTLVGNTTGTANLGTFTGVTIADSSTVKAALQSLETKVESLVSGLQFAGTWDATTAAPTLGNSEFVRVSTAGTTSVTTVNQGAKTDWAVGDFLMKDNYGNLHVIDNTDAPVNLAVGTVTTTTVPITNTLGTGFTIPAATTSLAGVVSSTDKTKLDNLGGYQVAYGGSTSNTITHSLGTKNVQVSVYRVSDDVQVYPTIVATSTSVVTITHSIAPAASSFRAVVSRTTS